MALILRRNEAERKKHGVNLILQYFIPIRHARYQRVYQLLNLNPKASHPILLSFFVFLHLFSFLSAIKKPCFYRFGPKASNSVCTLFLVRTCLKLPSPGHAKHCRWHHFWTGLARLFRTTRRNIEFVLLFLNLLVSFLFLM